MSKSAGELILYKLEAVGQADCQGNPFRKLTRCGLVERDIRRNLPAGDPITNT
jgi:hypothetical protein